MIVSPAQVPLATKLAYGVGAIAYGIKENGFATFLLLFYNQVIGLPADQVGLIIALALVFDAMIDPLLGVLSDRTRSRWGRRHPWLYASALPIAISWLLLWNPPTGSQTTILFWLLGAAVLTRAAMATNEVPSLALAPELTRDYHERTIVMRYRYLFGWIGGMAMLVLAYGWFLAPPRGAPSGPLALGGYHNYAFWGAVAMAATVLISAIGTHRYVMALPNLPVARQSFAQTVAAVRQTLSNRAFLVLMAAGILSYSAQGLSFSISNYNLAFVWQLGPSAFVAYSAVLIAGVTAAFFLVAPVSRALGKVRAAALLTVAGSALNTAPYLLRLGGLFPETGSPQLLPVFFAFNFVSVGLGVAAMIVGASMMSDVVEASEEMTGRREEGLFFAGSLFMQKCASGIGILLTGQILVLAAFPAGAAVGRVAPAILDRMTLYFCVAHFTLCGVAALVTLAFPFGKAEHDARLAKLAVAEATRG